MLIELQFAYPLNYLRQFSIECAASLLLELFESNVLSLRQGEEAFIFITTDYLSYLNDSYKSMVLREEQLDQSLLDKAISYEFAHENQVSFYNNELLHYNAESIKKIKISRSNTVLTIELSPSVSKELQKKLKEQEGTLVSNLIKGDNFIVEKFDDEFVFHAEKTLIDSCFSIRAKMDRTKENADDIANVKTPQKSVADSEMVQSIVTPVKSLIVDKEELSEDAKRSAKSVRFADSAMIWGFGEIPVNGINKSIFLFDDWEPLDRINEKYANTVCAVFDEMLRSFVE